MKFNLSSHYIPKHFKKNLVCTTQFLNIYNDILNSLIQIHILLVLKFVTDKYLLVI